MGYPLVICYIAIEHGPFIVDLPMKDCGFSSSLCEFTKWYFHGIHHEKMISGSNEGRLCQKVMMFFG
jgi:hypothetical protein